MVICSISFPGEAANINILPSLTLEEEWDSNIFNSSTNEESDFIFRARPALTLYLEAFHSTAKITGGFEYEKYAEFQRFDPQKFVYPIRIPRPSSLGGCRDG
jgi:hypothetical protein